MATPCVRRPEGLLTRVIGVSAARTANGSALADDLGHDPVARVEELLVDRLPAAEVLDGEHLLADREREVLQDALDDRPVTVLPPDLLRGRGVEELDERLGGGWVRGVRRDGDRVVDPERRLRD